MVPPDVVTVRYRVEPRDLRASLRDKLYWNPVVLFLAVAWVGAIVLFAVHAVGGRYLSGHLFVVIGGLVFAALPDVLARARHANLTPLERSLSWTFDPKTVALSDGESVHEMPWATFRGYRRTAEAYLLATHDGATFAIPKRALDAGARSRLERILAGSGVPAGRTARMSHRTTIIVVAAAWVALIVAFVLVYRGVS